MGRYVESMKRGNAFVACGSIQSVTLNLEQFKPDDFAYIIVNTWLQYVKDKRTAIFCASRSNGHTYF